MSGALREGRRGRRVLWAAWLVAFALGSTVPGCRSGGVLAAKLHARSSAAFTPNPLALIPYYTFGGLAFLLAAPLDLLSWPVTALTLPEDDPYWWDAALGPSWVAGSVVGSWASLPFAPFGLPWVPEPRVHSEPRP